MSIGLRTRCIVPLTPCRILPYLLPFSYLGPSLHSRWCPSTSHHPVSFLLLLARSFPLYLPFLSLGRLCQHSPRTFPVSLLSVNSTQRRATVLAVGEVCPSGHPKPAVRDPAPTAAFGPWDVHLQCPFTRALCLTLSLHTWRCPLAFHYLVPSHSLVALPPRPAHPSFPLVSCANGAPGVFAPSPCK